MKFRPVVQEKKPFKEKVNGRTHDGRTIDDDKDQSQST